MVAELACTFENGCLLGGHKTWYSTFSIIPPQHQGWALFAFTVVSFIAIGYGFYLIATDKRFDTQLPTRGKKKHQ